MTWPLLAIILCVIGTLTSGLFSGAETGAYRFNRTRHRLALASGRRRARLVETLTSDLTGFVVVCLVGTNLANGLVSYSATLAFASFEFSTPEFLATLIVGPILFLFGELGPKELFRRHSDRLLYAAAPLLRLASFVLRPLTWSLGLVTGLLRVMGLTAESPEPGEERLRQAIGAAYEGGTLTAYQATLARNIFSLRSRRVSDAMIPLEQVDCLDVSLGLGTARGAVSQVTRGRYPVYRERRDQVVGIVDLYDVLFAEGEGSLGDYAREILTVSPGEKVAEALMRMRRARENLAVVVEAGRALGIITLKDVVEEITGELQDF
jgi:CBS domain containing-hemolysin-like protein